MSSDNNLASNAEQQQLQIDKSVGRAPRHPTTRVNSIGSGAYTNNALSILPPPPPPPPRVKAVDGKPDESAETKEEKRLSPTKNSGVSSFYLDKFQPEYFSSSSSEAGDDDNDDDNFEDTISDSGRELTPIHSDEFDAEVNRLSPTPRIGSQMDLDSLLNHAHQVTENETTGDHVNDGNIVVSLAAPKAVALDVDSILAEAEELLSDFSGSSDIQDSAADEFHHGQHVSLSSILGTSKQDLTLHTEEVIHQTSLLKGGNSAQVLEKILAEKDFDDTLSHASTESLPTCLGSTSSALDNLNESSTKRNKHENIEPDDFLGVSNEQHQEEALRNINTLEPEQGSLNTYSKNSEDEGNGMKERCDVKTDVRFLKRGTRVEKDEINLGENVHGSTNQVRSISHSDIVESHHMNLSDALVEIGSDENITIIPGGISRVKEDHFDGIDGETRVESFSSVDNSVINNNLNKSLELEDDHHHGEDSKNKARISSQKSMESLHGMSDNEIDRILNHEIIRANDEHSKSNYHENSTQLNMRQDMFSQQTLNTTQTNRLKPTDDLSNAVLPDALMFVRQKIESLSFFDSDMMRFATQGNDADEDEDIRATQESLKRSFQQSISAAVLVSLAHKRYERRRLGAMEIEKIVRSLAQQSDFDRIRAILLLLSDDYVRSSNEDARKGGVVALAACAIGLKKADETNVDVMECKDLILASVVHCCQDHSQRVRYYATESLFNVVKVIPSLAVQHFFILFEILRSLYADVDHDVRSGAQLLDKKLKEIIVMATNNGSFVFETCVPLFTRFTHIPHKPTKKLTLTWLQEFVEKVLGSPVLEFLHLFLGGIFELLADATSSIRELALSFLEIVLPKLEVNNDQDFEVASSSSVPDFDKIIQVLVQTMEHPDPLVRKAVMSWITRIVHAHIDDSSEDRPTDEAGNDVDTIKVRKDSPASLAVRNSLPHMLPGVLLSIGDLYDGRQTDSSLLPQFSTRSLAERTNESLQKAVIREGSAFVSHLDGLTLALREELDSPGGISSKNAPAIERKLFRADTNPDGSGIESAGWFRTADDANIIIQESAVSRLCALQWVNVVYEYVVPDEEKAQHSKKFIVPIIQSLIWNPSDEIIFKSLEVLTNITIPQGKEFDHMNSSNEISSTDYPSIFDHDQLELSAKFSLEMLDSFARRKISRDREVFSVLVNLYSCHPNLIPGLPKVIRYMCTLQPPEFVFVSFALEINEFINKSKNSGNDIKAFSRDLEFASVFVQQISHVMLTAKETSKLRGEILFNCVGTQGCDLKDKRKLHLFNILLHSFSHNFIASLTLCLWAGAYQTASTVLHSINRMELNLKFFMELDVLIELIERPLFRRLHFKLLEIDDHSNPEGGGSMLFRTLKSILMILPQSHTYHKLKDRLVSAAFYRESVQNGKSNGVRKAGRETLFFVNDILETRRLHNEAAWDLLRTESLETIDNNNSLNEIDLERGRRDWVGYKDADEEMSMKMKIRAIKSGEDIVMERLKGSKGPNNAILDSLPSLPEDDDVRIHEENDTTNNGSIIERPLLRHPQSVFTDKNQISIKPNEIDGSRDEKGSNEQDLTTEWKEFWIS